MNAYVWSVFGMVALFAGILYTVMKTGARNYDRAKSGEVSDSKAYEGKEEARPLRF